MVQGIEFLVVTFRTLAPDKMSNKALRQLPAIAKLAQSIHLDGEGKIVGQGTKILRATSGDYTFSNRKWCVGFKLSFSTNKPYPRPAPRLIEQNTW